MLDKRVLWLFEYPSLNGGEHSLLATLPFLRNAGFKITAVAPSAGPLAEKLRQQGVSFEAWNPTDAAGATLSQQQKRERLEHCFGRLQPDLVHANSLSMTRTAAPVAQSIQVPCIGHLRDILRISKTAYADLNQATALIAVSAAVKDWHTSAGLDASITCVLHNGVDTQRFRPMAADYTLHRRFKLPEDAFLIGSVGQIGMRKGLDTLLAAAALVAEQCPSARFVLAGQRHSSKAEAIAYEQSLHEMAASPALAGKVYFAGNVDDMPGFYRNINALAHTANQEPLGRVLLEAAACGKPVVATEVGGTREIFPSGEAQLVPAGDEQSIARNLLQIYDSAQLQAALSANSRRRMEEAFNVQTAGPALAAAYTAANSET